jgi:hypothetical protein
MAGHDLIARYVDDLGTALRGRIRHSERVCTEIDDHLRSTADEMMHDRDVSEADAARSAIECFGPVDELAASFLTLERDGMGARATRFTTRAGLIGAIGGFLIAVAAAVQVARDGQAEPNPGGAGAAIGTAALIGAIAMVAVGFVGIVARHRGTFRRIDRLGLGLLALGLVTMWLPYYGILVIAVPLMLVGTILFGIRVYRVHALPRPPLAFMLGAGALLIALTVMKEHKGSVAFAGGWVLVLAGWCWLHFTLWSERAEQRMTNV